MKNMPVQKPGRSKQDYSTPNDFMDSVIKKFGPIDFDLAANNENAKSNNYFSEDDNSLEQDWTKLNGNLWLNPPYANIAPWAEKCKNSIGINRNILFLVPASIGSNWFYEHVYRFAKIYALNPRLSFDGKNAYPKDCFLAHYGGSFDFEVWRWK